MTDAVNESRSPRSELRDPDSAATEVADGILRIMLPFDAPGLGHVNCYALEDDRGIALIDPGVADGVSHQVLAERLRHAGLDISRVHTCVITHSHFDHYGGVARLRISEAVGSLAVVAHERFGQVWYDAYDHIGEDVDALEVNSLDDIEETTRFQALAQRYTRPTKWGTQNHPIPPELLAKWSDGLSVRDILRPPTPTAPIVDASTISLGGATWHTIHTPGHADDHVCLWNPESGVLFSGDHVLPTITPHIGGFSAYEDPLSDFFESLERMQSIDGVRTVLPAHGDPFTDLAHRSKTIADHHHDRLDQVRAIGEELGGAAPVDAFMRMLFRERSWGPLAASETFAHLEWLRIHSGATRSEVEGLAVYEL
ncbi:MAG: MBL fold metallo-hydrolase [Acidimicrobiales bacterium]